MLQQPPDEWTFLRPEEFTDDDAVDRADRVAELQPEEGAMHILAVDERSVSDPGRADVDAAWGDRSPDDRSRAPIRYFDDEEPEEGPAASADSEREPDLEEILESQHYAFGPDDG
jgi:hypothetical protein